MPTKTHLPTRKIIGSSVTALPFRAQIQLMVEWASNHESKVVCVANVHMLMEAYWQTRFAHVLAKADLVVPDGMPLVWMLRLLGVKKQDRVAGLDILTGACELAASQGVSVYFLGSQRMILDRMRLRLAQEFPTLKIAGMEPLPFRPLTLAEDQAVVERIHHSGAGFLFLSLGCPKQEYWMAEHQGQLQTVMIGLGGAFPVYAGIHKRAPRWIRQAGLEWAYRLMQEPGRLWKRYWTTNTAFIYLAVKQLLTAHLSGQGFSSEPVQDECWISPK
jgi:N-acetylglucosaminyldiphosphoundecaprenol N-acetyl-beta-D-mannosaminyltransferase